MQKIDKNIHIHLKSAFYFLLFLTFKTCLHYFILSVIFSSSWILEFMVYN